MKRKIILVATMVISIVAILTSTMPLLLKPIQIILVSSIGILWAKVLGEEPWEFFDNFGNYKQAKISAVLMVIIAIAVINLIIQIL